MAVIALFMLSLISVNMIQEYVIDRAKQSKGIAKVEPQTSANPLNERNTGSTAYGQAAGDDGFVE
jgi:hypothetical protein